MGHLRARHVGRVWAALLLVMVVAAACGSPPTPTALPLTQVPASPTPAVLPPTQTPVSPTPTDLPTAVPPTQTPLPATATTEAAPAGGLALGMRIYDTQFVASFVRPGDIFGTGYRRGVDFAANLLSSVPKENRMLMFATTDGLAEILDSLPIDITYIGYDLERWDATSAAEQQDPVEAVKEAQQIAHARGLKLVIGPSRYFNEKYGTQLAPYVDVYMPQAKFYQANLSAQQYQQTVGDLIRSLRQANPDMKVFLDLSPSPKNVEETPAEMLKSVESVQDLIDGVWVTYNVRETEKVGEFVRLVRP